jgi:hypothetical protein
MQGRAERGSKRSGAGRGVGRGEGRGRMGGTGMGPGGECFCHSCGKKAPHERGIPCNEVRCPECGNAMTRE